LTSQFVKREVLYVFGGLDLDDQVELPD